MKLASIVLLSATLCCSAEEIFTGPSVSVEISRRNWQQDGRQGMTFLEDHQESENRFVQRKGSAGYEARRYVYFKTEDPRFQQGRLPLVNITVEYFDQGTDRIRIAYDSLDPYVNRGTEREGVWKSQTVFYLRNSGEWQTAAFTLNDARFSGRCNGGDFRFDGRGKTLIIRKITITAANPAAQEQNAAAYARRPVPLEARIKPLHVTWEDAIARLSTYQGPVNPGVDTTTLRKKVMAGYQGWFRCPGDGSGQGFAHYGGFRPGDCSIDMWPDTSELDADEKYETEFRKADGSLAYVYSSYNKKSVTRHFKWMQEAGIHGVWLQRFINGTETANSFSTGMEVLRHVQEAANLHGRSWALMYDMSGGGGYERSIKLFKEDWRRLVDHLRLGKDPRDQAYQQHKGKPVVAIWGLFPDREGMPRFFDEIIDWLHDDPVYGGYTVMVGCANDWRFGTSAASQALRRAISKADIISPWTVGRYHSPERALAFIDRLHKEDLQWCRERGIDFLPVIFPGFSWYNLNYPNAPFDPIPRLQGRFFWSQVYANRRAGADMFYCAMFDEVDEGTALFKVDPDPPVGPSKFVSYGKLPTDHYMWLAGKAQEVLEEKIPLTLAPPSRPGVELEPFEIPAKD